LHNAIDNGFLFLAGFKDREWGIMVLVVVIYGD